MLCSSKLLYTFNRWEHIYIYIYNSTFQIIQAKKIEKYITIPMHFQKPQLEITIFRKIIKIDCYKFQKKKRLKKRTILKHTSGSKTIT